MNKNTKFIRGQLRFKRSYQEYADGVLRQLSDNLRTHKELLFVGMHIRRTDYIEFAKNRLNKVDMS